MYEAASPVRVFIDAGTTNRNKPHSQLNNHNYMCMTPANLLHIHKWYVEIHFNSIIFF